MTAAFNFEDMKRIDELAAMRGKTPEKKVDPSRLVRAAEAFSRLSQRPAFSPVVLAGIVWFCEALLIVGAGVLINILYVVPAKGHDLAYYVAIALISISAIFSFQAVRINNISAFRQPLVQGFRLAGAWTTIFLLAMAAIFFAKLEGVYSRVWLASWWGVGLGALLIWRGSLSAVTSYLTRIGRLDRRTVIVGGGEPAEKLIRELSKQENADIRIIGIFDDRYDERSPSLVAGFPKLGRLVDLVEFARHTRIDLVIFALPITAEERLLHMLRKLWVLPIDIRLSAHSNKLRFRPRSYSYIGTVPVLDVFDKPIQDWDVVLKALFDRVVGAFALIALSPIMLGAAIAVKMNSRGPVFFKQKRYGFNNELIEIYKFRSMYVEQLDPLAIRQVTRGDARVTSVGRILRKTSIDELPQLFNVVFKGNLSLVGPRPHAVHAMAADRAYDQVVDGYFARHRVRPGLTGWAQINGWRGETDTQEKLMRRVEFDLYYIENWSLLFDAYILLVTPFALLKTENAY